MHINFIIVIATAFIPLLIGFIWYNPKVFGTIWMQETGMTREKALKANMPKVFGLTFLLGIFISFAMLVMVVHQMHVYSIFANNQAELKDPTSPLSIYYKNFMDLYGQNFRTFKHGAFHGIIGSFTIVLPVVGINALFEQKSFKYVALHVGFWMICMALMGGIICQWA